MGRPKNIHTPIKYFNKYEKEKAITQSKSKYMLNKSWQCSLCDNRDYTLAGKWSHLKTKKHMKNAGL